MNEIHLLYASIRYEEPVVYFTYKKDIELGFPEIKELIFHAETLSGHKPYVTLADIRANVSVTNEGKRYLENLENMPLFRGTAALVKNNIIKIAANFFSQYKKSKYPFKAFTDEKGAVEWLKALPLD